jgi:uncharacterized damage-inducible protein DinB
MDVKDLIRYNHIVRDLYFQTLSNLSWTEFTQNRGLSFDSIRNVLLHLTMVEERWITYIIPDRFSEWQNPDFNAYNDTASLSRYIEQVKTNTHTYLSKLTPKELAREINLSWANQPDTKITIEKGLTHMVLEDMIHYGELSAALWQMGLEAPYMGFWRYGISEPVIASYEPKQSTR